MVGFVTRVSWAAVCVFFYKFSLTICFDRFSCSIEQSEVDKENLLRKINSLVTTLNLSIRWDSTPCFICKQSETRHNGLSVLVRIYINIHWHDNEEY